MTQQEIIWAFARAGLAAVLVAMTWFYFFGRLEASMREAFSK
jgi:hypothetical protein